MDVYKVLPVAAILLTLGCEDETSSTGYPSGLMSAEIRVTSNGHEKTTVKVNLYGTDYIDGMFPVEESVRLEDGDELMVTANGITYTLTENNSASNLGYTAEFNFDTGPTDFNIHFNRPGRSEVLESRITSPQDMLITSPLNHEALTLDASFEVSWSPAIENSNVCICVSTGCFQDDLDSTENCNCTVEDDGVHALKMTELFQESRYSLVSALSCSVDISISRKSSGTLSEGFSSGDIQSTQTRSLTVNFGI